MKKIKTCVRVAVIDELSDSLLRRWDEAENLHDDALLSSSFEKMRVLSAKITESIKRDAVLSQLDKADEARDEKIRSLSALLSGYRAISIPEMQKAAEVLKAIFDKYGRKIEAAPYAEESALVESLLQDFSADVAKEAISALAGMSDAVAALRKAQDDFDAAQDAFVSAKTARGESASDLKKPLVAIVNAEIADYLSAARLMRPEKYEAFAALVEAEIARAN